MVTYRSSILVDHVMWQLMVSLNAPRAPHYGTITGYYGLLRSGYYRPLQSITIYYESIMDHYELLRSITVCYGSIMSHCGLLRAITVYHGLLRRITG